MNNIPSPDVVFPNEYGTSCFLKNVITAPNISVGDYTYSVVARDVEPHAVVGGNPARILKKRFSQELTGLLLGLRWRDFPPEKPADFLPVLRNENLDGVIRDMPDS